MKKYSLPNVTLIGADCVNLDGLVLAGNICQEKFEFGAVKYLTSLPAKNHKNVIPIKHIGSEAEYSEFFLKNLNKFF